MSSVCIVEGTGTIIRETKVASEPDAVVALVGSLGFAVKRIGLEAGPLSQWLHAGLMQAGYDAVLLETRHVKAALSAMIVKTSVEQNKTFNLATLAIDAALAGQGIAVASRLYVQRELDSGRLVQVVDTVLNSGRDYHALLPSRSKNHRAAKAVWDWLMQETGRHGD